MNSKVYIFQIGNIPGERLIEELEHRGGLNNRGWGGRTNAIYCIGTDMRIKRIYSKAEIPEGYSELCYSPDNDTFYESDSQRMQSARAKEALLPDDAREVGIVEKDGAFEVNIPEGYEATVEEGKVVIRKRRWKPEMGEHYCRVQVYVDLMEFHVAEFFAEKEEELDWYEGGWLFETREEAEGFCDRLNAAIKPLAEERRRELGLSPRRTSRHII